MNKPLPHVRIKAINSDLIRYVQSSKKTTLSGAGLRLIYKNNYVESPFDDTKMYKIFLKNGEHCLVIEITEDIAA